VTRVNSDDGKSSLTGGSQDELVLMQMVENEQIGKFISRDSDFMTIDVCGKVEMWRLLKYFQFTSERKLMSRVLQNSETGEVIVFTKGADSSLIPLCVKSNEQIQRSVDHFAS
jgi:magnesium-transporting ATPase (P-type)